MLVRRPSCMVLALLVVAAVSGCASNGPQLPSMNIEPSSEPAQSAGVSPAPGSTPGSPDEPHGTPLPGAVGSATEIYSHIARGAMACWFAVNGPLKKDYIFHAAADAPSRGGKAVVTIHQRDPSQPNPRGAKAYVVEIIPTGETTASVTVENRKMSDAYATAMTDDISRWAKDGEGCTGTKTAVGWAPTAAQTHTETPKTAKKTAKTKVKAAQAKAAPQQSTQP